MATEAELLAIPLEYQYKGKTYKISRVVTFGMEAAFADWVYMEAIGHTERMRAMYIATSGRSGLNDDQYERAFDRITDRLSMGEYAWGSETVTNKANKSWAGIRYLIMLRMQMYDQTVGPALLDEIFSDADARAELFKVLNRPFHTAEAEEESKEKTQPPAV